MKKPNHIVIILAIVEVFVLIFIAGSYVNKFIIHKDTSGNTYHSSAPAVRESYIDPVVAAEGVEEILDNGSDAPPRAEGNEAATPENATAPENATTTAAFSEAVTAKLNAMSLDDKIFQMFVISPEALTGSDKVTASGEKTQIAYNATPVGGMVYADKNYETKMQTTLMVQQIQQYSTEKTGLKLFIFTKDSSNEVIADRETVGINAELATTVAGAGNFLLVTDETCPEIEAEETAYTNSEIIQTIREVQGYQGLLAADLTDENAEQEIDRAELMKAINCGINLIYNCTDYQTAASVLKAAVESGEIPESTINQSVGRIVSIKLGETQP